MAQQDYNFSNPTITSDQPMGWQLANQNTAQAINNIGGYLKDQQDKVQSLQMQQAGDLSKAHVMASLYYPQAVPQVESMMAQNPYARRAFPQSLGQSGQSQGQSGQPMGGNPNMMGSMIGAPGTTSYGTGMLPQPSGGTGGAPSQTGGGVSMNPVSTGMTVTSGGLEPPKFSQSIVNPVGETVKAQATAQGEANVAPGKTYSTEQATNIATAGKTAAADKSTLYTLGDALKKSYQNYNTINDAGWAGDDYKKYLLDNQDKFPSGIPGQGGSQFNYPSFLMPPDNVKQAYGNLTANRNESIIRQQPILSQTLQGTSSSRIQNSLVDMSKTEFGDVNDRKLAYQGATYGTADNAYRMWRASNMYGNELKSQGLKLPVDQNGKVDNDAVTKQLSQGMDLNKFPLSPQEQKDHDNFIKYIMPDYNPSVGGQMGGSVNPVMNQGAPKAQPTQGNKQKPQQNNVAQQFTRQEILDELNRRKNLRDVTSNISQ